MAKKRSPKSARRVRRKPSRRTAGQPAAIKIFGALAVLLLLLCGAGLLANYVIDRPPSGDPRMGNAPLRSKQRQAATPERPADKPAYEVSTNKALPPKPLDKLPQLPGSSPPLVAIIVDDIGYDRHITHQLLELDAPLTYSILPHGPYSRKLAAAARSRGREIMLHLPMEPAEFPQVNPGPGALLSQMSPDELIGQLNDNLGRISGLKGVNNHMGSGLSASSEKMRQIFTVLKSRGLYYVDSRTTADTVARSSARLLQVPFAERDVFIDHLENEKFIRGQLKLLIKRAHHQGYALGIAHPHAVTYKMLAEVLPELKKEVELVPASMVVEAEMAAHRDTAQALR